MYRISLFFALALLVLGCSRTDDFDGYSKQSGDLGAFVLQHASTFGARIRSTNSLPQLSAEWRYKEDADGFQIYVVGDYFRQLESFLTTAFGPPAHAPTTNELAGTKHIGTYYGAELGAALSYSLETTRDGKQFTSMVVVKRRR